jgi:8-oxo-dGTP diphosphatase
VPDLLSTASFRLAAYAVCIESGQVLLVRCVSPEGDSTWSLPGGRVEQGEDPFDAVIRELAEETGLEGVVERLLGVDSRVIPPSECRFGRGHQNVGVFYGVRIIGGASSRRLLLPLERLRPHRVKPRHLWPTPAERVVV